LNTLAWRLDKRTQGQSYSLLTIHVEENEKTILLHQMRLTHALDKVEKNANHIVRVYARDHGVDTDLIQESKGLQSVSFDHNRFVLEKAEDEHRPRGGGPRNCNTYIHTRWVPVLTSPLRKNLEPYLEKGGDKYRIIDRHKEDT
jgi:hypothetical protein